MNIGIVTVYNSENCGSFLQAYALGTALKKDGNNVYYIKREVKGTSHALMPHIVDSCKKLIKLNYPAFKSIWERYFGFSKAQKSFKEITAYSQEYKKLDRIILGSDTIWNISSPYFKKNINTFFGIFFNEKAISSYGASIANTDIAEFQGRPEISNALKNMSSVSVRDMKTAEMVKMVSGRDATLVCDPTLLLSKEDYNNLISNEKKYEDAPILIYYFGNMDNSLIKSIRTFAEKNHKKIISFGQYNSWCDINVPFNPYEFLYCFRDCSYVITNTYHGTIFSLIYEKKFADYGQEKDKIKYLLNSLNAASAFFNKEESLDRLLDSYLDYQGINEKIKELQTKSFNFLRENVLNNEK